MIQEIDKIAFGNPSQRDRLIMTRETYLDKLLPALKTFAPPKNSSTVTKSELNQLITTMAQKRPEEDFLYDESLINYVKGLYINGGADAGNVNSIVTNVQLDVGPLITKLKYVFNRPRPAQLAYYYGLELYPDFSYFTNSPSYPSLFGRSRGHLLPKRRACCRRRVASRCQCPERR